MATRPEHPWISVEEYMQIDQTSDTRYEYWDGQLVAMSESTIDHGRIARNIEAWIETRLDPRCRVHRSDIKLRLSASKYVLPDVHITCDPTELRGNKQAISHPKLIFEVLSPSTESTDRAEKLEWYCAIPTMQEYVLVNHRHRLVEIYRRHNDEWLYQTYRPGQHIPLTSLNLTIPVDVIYNDTEIPLPKPLYPLVDDPDAGNV